ncbi:hypothetical protein ACVWXM_010005 [Bradyrhizobium sp. GM7.3]
MIRVTCMICDTAPNIGKLLDQGDAEIARRPMQQLIGEQDTLAPPPMMITNRLLELAITLPITSRHPADVRTRFL